MEIVSTAIPEVRIIRPKKIGDARGFFSETYKRNALAAAGVRCHFVQDNQSLSAQRGVVRGLHYQVDPHAQTKLIRVLHGAIFDVAVDLRKGSPTFGRHVEVIVSALEWNQVLIPKGFAHGFCTLEPDTEVLYKVDDYWMPEYERGIKWNDSALGIAWPISEAEAILSDRDGKNPRFAEVTDLFDFSSQ